MKEKTRKNLTKIAGIIAIIALMGTALAPILIGIANK